MVLSHGVPEHWSNALNGGKPVALSMLGQQLRCDCVPYFFTDQYHLGTEYAGWVEPGGYDSVVFRGAVQAREFIAFWVKEGRVRAGMNVNVWDVQDQIQTLVQAGFAGKTVNPTVPLADLAA